MPTKRRKKGNEAKRPVIERAGNGRGDPTVEGKTAGMPWPIGLEKSALGQESDYYRAHLPEWYEHEGKHVLIHGSEFCGFFATEETALEEGFRRFGRAPFLVKQVQRDEKPRHLGWVIF